MFLFPQNCLSSCLVLKWILGRTRFDFEYKHPSPSVTPAYLRTTGEAFTLKAISCDDSRFAPFDCPRVQGIEFVLLIRSRTISRPSTLVAARFPSTIRPFRRSLDSAVLSHPFLFACVIPFFSKAAHFLAGHIHVECGRRNFSICNCASVWLRREVCYAGRSCFPTLLIY